MWSQYRSRALTQPSAVARATDTFIALGSSETHGHKHSFMTAQTADIHTVLGGNSGYRIDMVPSCSRTTDPDTAPHWDISMAPSCSRTRNPFLLRLFLLGLCHGNQKVTNTRALGRAGFGLPSSRQPEPGSERRGPAASKFRPVQSGSATVIHPLPMVLSPLDPRG